MMVNEEKLQEFLLDTGLVSRVQLEEAKQLLQEGDRGSRSLHEALMVSGAVTRDEMRRAQAVVFGIPFVVFQREQIDPAVLSLIPEPIARAHNVVAYRREGDTVQVAMLDMSDLAAIDFVRTNKQIKFLPRLTSDDSIRSALLQYQSVLRKEFGEHIAREAQSLQQQDILQLSDAELKKLSGHLSAMRVVDALLRHAIAQGASDVHIEPQERGLLIRYRIDGVLRESMMLPKAAANGVALRIKALSGMSLGDRSLQEGRFKVGTGKQQISIRASALPVYYGEKLVLRLLADGQHGLSFEKIGLCGDRAEEVHRALRQPGGLVLVAGPDRSGKTTTLYSLLDLLNTPHVSISTIEDQIHRQMPRVSQLQVRPETGITFAHGLRALLRHDPDVVMVGKLEDEETADLAFSSARTGRRFLSAVPADSAAQAVEHLRQLGIDPLHIASTLRAVVGQRLVGGLGEEKERYQPTQRDLQSLSRVADLNRVLEVLKEERVVDSRATWRDIPFYRPASQAQDGGYPSRIGIFEVLPVSSSIKELIMQGAPADDIGAQARADGMLSLVEDGVCKAAQGLTSLEEVLRATLAE